MAGLGVLLEPKQQQRQQHSSSISNSVNPPKILNKTAIVLSSSPPPLKPSPSSSFLDSCFLCHKRLSHTKDIYIYRGDRAFCSVECRCKHIVMDEENIVRENCGLAAAGGGGAAAAGSRHRAGKAPPGKTSRPAAGGFAY